MYLSRSDFSHYETSGSVIKLTKISCDIAATLGAEPLNPTAPRGVSSVAPSGHLTRSSICRKPSCPSCRYFVGLPRAAMLRSRPVSPMVKIGRKFAHDERYRFVLRRSSVISFYRYPASRPSALSPDPPLGTSLSGRAFRSGSPQRKSLPLWSPKH